MHVDVWNRFTKWFHPVYVGEGSIADAILFRQLEDDPHLSNARGSRLFIESPWAEFGA